MDTNFNEFENTPIVIDENPTEQVVSVWKYFGMTLLYFIPIVGLIACIVMSIVAKNKNVKNHARGMLIWLGLSLVIGGIFVGVITVKVTTFVKETISQVEQYVETFEQLNELVDTFGEVSDTLEQTEGMPDLTELLEGFENGNLEDVMGSFDSE